MLSRCGVAKRSNAAGSEPAGQLALVGSNPTPASTLTPAAFFAQAFPLVLDAFLGDPPPATDRVLVRFLKAAALRSRHPYEVTLRADPCAYCGGPGGTVDHIQPRSHYGANNWRNLTGACDLCNRHKRSADLLEFLAARRAGRQPRQPMRVRSRRPRPPVPRMTAPRSDVVWNPA